MKTVLPLFLIFSNALFSQKSFVSNDLVVSNPSRDTAYIKNDQTGRNIYLSWKRDPYYNGKKVVVTLVDDLTPYHQLYSRLSESDMVTSEKRRRKSKN
jgi:hypothetical protein